MLAVTVIAAACSLGLVAGADANSTHNAPPAPSSGAYSDAPKVPLGYRAPADDGLGVRPGKIKHVWLIVLENKAYDSTFTGLNNNTYLWQTLPSQGALLQNYYGTGHSSQDNYLALTSGQAPITDTQDDCPAYTAMAGAIDTGGSITSNPNYGQFKSAAGPNAPSGANGCVYPKSVPTIFNQLDAAHEPWKLYAQDLGNPDTNSAPHDAGTQYCGADDPAVGPLGASGSQYPVNGSANETDQYVAYHNPLPWYESILKSGDCNDRHLANMFSSTDGLFRDLQHDSTTPTFSFLLPNDCSDGHDAVCKGNNLSGGWANPTTPKSPVNYTGGLCSADLYLEHIIPEIEASPAFRDGGLIDITFDEAYPQFTYSNSFANATLFAPTAATDLFSTDSAGETLWGRSVPWEPTGPNVPNVTAANGQQLSAGPGFNENLDRPSASTIAGTNLVACTGSGIVSQGQCYLGGGGNVPGPSTQTASAAAGTSTIGDNSVNLPDEGRTVTGTGIPAGAYVGTVTDTPATATVEANSGGISHTGSFVLVNSSGQPLNTTAAVTSVTLGAQTPATDPKYDAYDPTTGGGDSGDVLISPYIRPGTVSTRDYNHYATLRTLEDLFRVSRASPGLDGEGHLGYADQPGLAPFGSDVFTNPQGYPMFGRGYSVDAVSSGGR
ncbi:MAG TPA: alkaline phosphatase family protein [Solirubrobacteraceae bacterium]|nr:alkaline phosphatase family protein [Solirubrobacteraceae bacterium]